MGGGLWVTKLNRFYYQNTKEQVGNCILQIGIISVRHLKLSPSIWTFWIWLIFCKPYNWIKRFNYYHFMQALIFNVLSFHKLSVLGHILFGPTTYVQKYKLHYSELSNKSGHHLHLFRWENVELGLFFNCVGEKTWSLEKFLKKNKKNSTLIREFRVHMIKSVL